MSLTTRTLRVACVAVLATSLAACGGGHKKKSTQPTTTAPTTSAATSTTPAPPPAPNINPFTGLKPSGHRTVAVKIDDTANGRPQLGINKADIVYVEEVEGGLTRLLAIYNTSLPTVEAVRSTRASDPEVMGQYGRVAYVASGGAPNPLQVLDRSNLIPVINDRGGPGFARDGGRPAPYNLTANLAQVAASTKGGRAKDVGFTWGTPANNALAHWPKGLSLQTVVGGTTVTFRWDPTIHRYVRLIDGVVQRTADGHVISTPNVIIQFCTVTAYPQDVDVVGNVSQYTHTIGSGRAVIYRDGHKRDGVWSRSRLQSGTVWRTASGHRIPLHAGGAWIILVAKGAPLS